MASEPIDTGGRGDGNAPAFVCGRYLLAEVTRRFALMGGAGAAAALSVPALLKAAPADVSPDVIILGSGIFGAWTARRLQELGRRVTLVDAWAPSAARAPSGGQSRLTRGTSGGGN